MHSRLRTLFYFYFISMALTGLEASRAVPKVSVTIAIPVYSLLYVSTCIYQTTRVAMQCPVYLFSFKLTISNSDDNNNFISRE